MKTLLKLALACLFTTASAFAQEAPVPLRTAPPEYPEELRQDGVRGLVTVKCAIDEQGNVTEATVEKSSNAAFDKAALAAIKKWKFKPASQDGKPVAVKISIPIKFIPDS